MQRANWHALEERGQQGLVHPARTAPPNHMGHDVFATSWFERYARSAPGTIAGGTSEIHRNVIAERILGLTPVIATAHVLEEAVNARR